MIYSLSLIEIVCCNGKFQKHERGKKGAKVMFLCVIIGYILKQKLLKKPYFIRGMSSCVIIC
nr:MAG TPA: hypothetical protein [Caudoviricetes sp.]